MKLDLVRVEQEDGTTVTQWRASTSDDSLQFYEDTVEKALGHLAATLEGMVQSLTAKVVLMEDPDSEHARKLMKAGRKAAAKDVAKIEEWSKDLTREEGEVLIPREVAARVAKRGFKNGPELDFD